MSNNSSHTCPWWLLPAFDNPVRWLIHDPRKILAPYVHAGDTVLDVGCGMGYFTLGLARLVGVQGGVIAADLQPKMMAGLHRRAERAGLLDVIQMVNSTMDRIGVDTPLDFALAFWMVHEVGKPEAFLKEIYSALKPGGSLLIVEPCIHVTRKGFDATLSLAHRLGFKAVGRPPVNLSRTVLLQKS